MGYNQSLADNSAYLKQEVVLDQLHSRLVQLELQDRRCLNDARRHRAAGTKTLFRSKMLEHRRLQGQMAQLHRFKESAMAQFDALSNHELNRTFIKAMQGVVGASKGHVAASREDAETVMEDLQESMSQVKDLSEFLGQPIVNGMGDEITDEELESDFLENSQPDFNGSGRIVVDDGGEGGGESCSESRADDAGADTTAAVQRSLEHRLVVPAALLAVN
jgi:hypothetical protein